MPNLLFICSRNQWRSPTAASLFRNTDGVKVRSAGTSSKARKKVSNSDLNWADLIFVMEKKHKNQLQAKFSESLQDKPIHVLGIPDEYRYMDEELIDLLNATVTPFLL
ncbi:MAG: protein tyrosine phosphatase [Cyanobacteria bacterium P01_E01_bin.42]